MLIVGAGGLAKEVLEIFNQLERTNNLSFYDDVNSNTPETLYGLFTVLKNMDQVKAWFKKDPLFTIGVGQPALREKLYRRFWEAGGQFATAISPLAHVGHYGTALGDGCIVMAGTVITNDVQVGKGGLINPNCVISHDSQLGDFVELSPGVKITGNCVLGNYCTIGTGAILLPKIKLGEGVTVGAGAVVTKNVAAGITVAGVPAIQLKHK